MYVCDFACDSPRIPVGVCGWEGEAPLLRGLGWGGGVGKCRRAGPCQLGGTWTALCRRRGLVPGRFERGAADWDLGVRGWRGDFLPWAGGWVIKQEISCWPLGSAGPPCEEASMPWKDGAGRGPVS